MLGFRPKWTSPVTEINRYEASAEENAPYGKINIRPRLLSDVKSNPKQTWHSGLAWAHHQGNIGLNAVA